MTGASKGVFTSPSYHQVREAVESVMKPTLNLWPHSIADMEDSELIWFQQCDSSKKPAQKEQNFVITPLKIDCYSQLTKPHNTKNTQQKQ